MTKVKDTRIGLIYKTVNEHWHAVPTAEAKNARNSLFRATFDSRLKVFNIGSLAVVHVEQNDQGERYAHWVDIQDCQ